MRSIPNRFPHAAAFVACALVATASYAADPMTTATGGNLQKADRTFVEKAAVGGMTEVALSKLAQDKSTNATLKQYATRMVDDHTKANADLMKVASSEGVTPPAGLDASHQKNVDKLSQMNGADFDKAYVKMMVSDHKDTVSLFEKEAKSGKDANLKQFASTTLPTLQDHLKMIQDIQKKM